MSEASSVGVFIASWNTAAATELTVRTALRLAGTSCVVTVGDGGSTDSTRPMLARLSTEYRERLRVELVEGGRTHAGWLDHWTANSDSSVLVFVDSDVRFRRKGWLAELVGVAESQGADIVAGELLPEVAGYVEPVGGTTVRLAARPAPWLLLIRREPVSALGSSFAFQARSRPDLPEGVLACDVGAAVFADAQAAGLHCLTMPATFGRAFHHYGGMSWRSQRSLRDGRRTARAAAIPLHLVMERLRSS